MCVQDELATCAVYCCPKCQAEDWPKHKRWHKQQRQLEKEHQIVESTPTAWSLGGFQQMVVDKKASGSNYQELVATGFELMQKGHFKAATKKLRRAIALDPEQPDAYGALSEAMEWSNDTVAGARLKVQALERADKRSRFWACTAAAAFDSIRAVLPNGMEVPDWWNDEDLLSMSATVLSVLSHEQNHMPFLMRARVLVHGTGVTNGTFWQPGPRGVEDIVEAAKCYSEVALLWPVAFPEEKQQFEGLSLTCLAHAASMD